MGNLYIFSNIFFSIKKLPLNRNYTVGRGIHIALPAKHSKKLPAEFKTLNSTRTTYFCTTKEISELNARIMVMEDEIIAVSAESCMFFF